MSNKHTTKHLIISTILTISISLVACKDGKSTLKKEIVVQNEVSQNEISLDEKHLIRSNGVDDFVIGNSLPQELNKYKFVNSSRVLDEGEEPIVIVISSNDTILEISFDYDYDKGHYTDKIGEILIKHKKYTTTKNCSVGTTLADFINSYTDYSLWYTYISNSYVVDSKTENSLQFSLDEKGYVGDKDLMAGDRVDLDINDFKPNTRIAEIRIWDNK